LCGLAGLDLAGLAVDPFGLEEAADPCTEAGRGP